MQEITGDPQFTTQGAYRQIESTGEGPGEGQRGRPRKKAPPRERPRRPSVAARRGLDETGSKNRLGEKAKNPHQIRNPRVRRAKAMGPTGRARAGIGRRPKGRTRTKAGILDFSTGKRAAKGSPNAKRREGNRNKRPHSGGSPPKRRGGGLEGRNLPP